MDAGGYVKRVNVERMQMDEIEKEAIEVSMNYGSSTAVPVSQKAPEFSEIRFAHIRGNHAAIGVSLCGLPESPLREITLKTYRSLQKTRCGKSMWKSKILFLWGVCAYECLTFRRFGANLKKSRYTQTRGKREYIWQILYREISSCAFAACCEEMRKGGWKMALEWQD